MCVYVHSRGRNLEVAIYASSLSLSLLGEGWNFISRLLCHSRLPEAAFSFKMHTCASARASETFPSSSPPTNARARVYGRGGDASGLQAYSTVVEALILYSSELSNSTLKSSCMSKRISSVFLLMWNSIDKSVYYLIIIIFFGRMRILIVDKVSFAFCIQKSQSEFQWPPQLYRYEVLCHVAISVAPLCCLPAGRSMSFSLSISLGSAVSFHFIDTLSYSGFLFVLHLPEWRQQSGFVKRLLGALRLCVLSCTCDDENEAFRTRSIW